MCARQFRTLKQSICFSVEPSAVLAHCRAAARRWRATQGRTVMVRVDNRFGRRTFIKGAAGAAAVTAATISLPGRATLAQSGEGNIIVSTWDFAQEAMTPIFEAFTA